MNLFVVIAIPFITAFIGWLTNLVAIKMLFRPRKPVNLAGYKVQGLVPRRHKEIAAQAGEIVEREFLSQHFIRSQIEEIDLRPHVEEFCTRMVWNGLAPRLKNMPMVGAFINDETLFRLYEMARDEMLKESKPILEKMAGEAEKRLDVREIVRERIENFEMDKLETVVQEVATRELRSIELLGGVLGFVVGLFQLLILWLTGSLGP